MIKMISRTLAIAFLSGVAVISALSWFPSRISPEVNAQAVNAGRTTSTVAATFQLGADTTAAVTTSIVDIDGDGVQDVIQTISKPVLGNQGATITTTQQVTAIDGRTGSVRWSRTIGTTP